MTTVMHRLTDVKRISVRSVTTALYRRNVARVTDAEQMVELLTYASFAKVGAALGVSRNAVSRWSRGLDVTPYRLSQVQQLLRPESESDGRDITMIRRLLAGVMALEDRGGISPEALEQAQTKAATFERLALEADRRAAERLGQSRRTRSRPAVDPDDVPVAESPDSTP